MLFGPPRSLSASSEHQQRWSAYQQWLREKHEAEVKTRLEAARAERERIAAISDKKRQAVEAENARVHEEALAQAADAQGVTFEEWSRSH